MTSDYPWDHRQAKPPDHTREEDGEHTVTEEAAENGQKCYFIIQRAGGYYKDKLRAYDVKVDGEVVEKISEYDSLSLKITPGLHDFQVTIDHFFHSQTLTLRIEAGITRRLVCAAGQISGFGESPGYIKLYEGELNEVAPPEPTIL